MSGYLALTSSAPTAPHHYTDWTTWNWVAGLGGALALFAIAIAAMWVFVDLDDGYQSFNYRPRSVSLTQLKVGAGALALITATAGALIHGNVARHIATPGLDRLWLFVPALVAGALAVLAYRLVDKAYGYVVAGTVFVIGVASAINDALNRVASWIPTTVGALIGTGVLVIAGFFLHSRSQAPVRRGW